MVKWGACIFIIKVSFITKNHTFGLAHESKHNGIARIFVGHCHISYQTLINQAAHFCLYERCNLAQLLAKYGSQV